MLINRNNYEDFFIRYADGELSRTEKMAVENFLEACPDLREELEYFQTTVATPDPHLVFDNRDLLKRSAHEPDLADANFEEWVICYHDGELNEVQRNAVERFAQSNTRMQQILNTGAQLIFQPDLQVLCPAREQLYRSAARRPVFRMMAEWAVAAAVLILMLVTTLLYFNHTGIKPADQPVLAAGPALPQPPLAVAKLENRVSRPAGEKMIPRVNPLRPVAKIQPASPPQAIQKKEVPPQKLVLISPGAIETGVPEEAAASESVALNLRPARVSSPGHENVQVTVAAPGPDQPILLKEPVQAQWASSSQEEEGHLIPGAGKAEHAIRNFIQRTSAAIHKKAHARAGDGNRKTILVGGFEFALN